MLRALDRLCFNIKCVDLFPCRMIRDLQKWLSPLIFAEFSGMIFLITVIAFPIFQTVSNFEIFFFEYLKSDNRFLFIKQNSSFGLTIPRIIKFTLLGVLAITSLLMFSFLGNVASDEVRCFGPFAHI